MTSGRSLRATTRQTEILPVSVIVITRNAASTLDECLSAIARNNPAEVIVVDGSSSDGTLAIARRYTDRIFDDEGRGKGVARQIGTEKANQEYVAHVDSDVFLTEGALETLLTEFQNSGCVSMHALGELRPQGKKLTYWEWAQSEHAQLSWYLSKQDPRLGTASCIFYRETLLKYGFEAGYGGGLDDIDLENRLRKAGQKFGVSSARVYFHYRSDMSSFFKVRFMWGRVAAGYVRKYGMWHARFWPPLRVVYWLGICAVKGQIKLVPYFILDGIAGTLGMMKGFIELVKKAPGKTRSNSAS